MDLKSTKNITKEELIKVLKKYQTVLKNEKGDEAEAILADVDYTLKVTSKDMTKATKKELVELVNDTRKYFEDHPVESSKEEGIKEQEQAAVTSENSIKKPSDENKPATKLVKSTKTSPKSEEVAIEFPSEFELKGSKYVIAHDIKNTKDINKAYNEEGVEIAFAFYWTPRQLRQYVYFEGRVPVSSFENDLDICQVFFCEDGLVAYCVSMYTCAAYTVFDNELEEFEGIRMSHGIEFQVYRLVKE